MMFRIRTREELWKVYDIEADSEDEAKHFVESNPDVELEGFLVDDGVTFCGIEDIEQLEQWRYF